MNITWPNTCTHTLTVPYHQLHVHITLTLPYHQLDVHMYMYLIINYMYTYTNCTLSSIRCTHVHITLSSIVSNFVSTIPSIQRGSCFPVSAWSIRALLNFTSWSTASLPTRASPTNKTISGVLTRINWSGMEREREEKEWLLLNCTNYTESGHSLLPETS